jgi:hypothetical protein
MNYLAENCMVLDTKPQQRTGRQRQYLDCLFGFPALKYITMKLNLSVG